MEGIWGVGSGRCLPQLLEARACPSEWLLRGGMARWLCVQCCPSVGATSTAPIRTCLSLVVPPPGLLVAQSGVLNRAIRVPFRQGIPVENWRPGNYKVLLYHSKGK